MVGGPSGEGSGMKTDAGNRKAMAQFKVPQVDVCSCGSCEQSEGCEVL